MVGKEERGGVGWLCWEEGVMGIAWHGVGWKGFAYCVCALSGFKPMLHLACINGKGESLDAFLASGNYNGSHFFHPER